MEDELIVTEGAKRIDAEFLPSRLCIEPGSRYFSGAASVIGVRLDGKEVVECIEYAVLDDEQNGWVRVGQRRNGKLVRVHLQTNIAYASTQLYGKVEPYFRQPASRQVRRQLARLNK